MVVFAREMEVELTDAALTMFDKMMGGVFRKADRRHKDQLVKPVMTITRFLRQIDGNRSRLNDDLLDASLHWVSTAALVVSGSNVRW